VQWGRPALTLAGSASSNSCYGAAVATSAIQVHNVPNTHLALHYVAVFLRTEITSTRFAQDILAILVRDGQPRTIVEQPNLADQPTEQLILASYTVL
jgi:hypothetical protein